MSEVRTNYYVWGLDLSGTLQGAGGIGGLIAAIQDGDVCFPYYDANGNVTELVDTNGTTVAHYEYDPYGNIVVQTGSASTNNSFRFSTKYRDEETGWYYYGYRYYSPELGRWTRRDPLGRAFTLNLYDFVHNGPQHSFDVLGLYDWSGPAPGNTPGFTTIPSPKSTCSPGDTKIETTTITCPCGQRGSKTEYFECKKFEIDWHDPYNPKYSRHIEWYDWVLVNTDINCP